MFRIVARATGPIFDLRARMAARRAVEQAQQEIATRGENLIRFQLDRVLKTQTPYYRTQIQTERAGRDLAVSDGGVVYGPWLEGVSERNRTTRFKGYRTFRIITRQLQREAPDIADKVVFRYTREMQ